MLKRTPWLVCWLYSYVLPLAHAWLYSYGTEIRSTTTFLPVRLRCINWYGAHKQSFMAGGLDKRSCRDIAESIKEIGANCVRIPLSVELVIENPTPNASAVAGIERSECNVSTALQVLDCQVKELTRWGLMVILNNHNSIAGWVGAGERVPQGLWHSARFPTREWIASLSALASRYKSNPLVVGIDIWNEIHDQDGIVITWGQTDNVQSDWKTATLYAPTHGVLASWKPERTIENLWLLHARSKVVLPDTCVRALVPQSSTTEALVRVCARSVLSGM